MLKDDEILIWKYLDGLMSESEVLEFLNRNEVDLDLKNELDWDREVDKAILDQPVFKMTSSLRSRILQEMTKPGKKASSTSWFSSGLKYFTLFNVLIFIAGMLLILFPFNASSQNQSEFWRTYLHLLNTPIVQTIFIIGIGFFGLLWFDQWLKKQNHGKLTTPV